MDHDHVEPPFSIRTAENKVYGCATDVWVALIDNKLYQDSSGIFVRGIMGTMLDHLENINYEDINNISIKDFPFLTPEKISMRRMRGFDIALKKIQKLLAD